MALMYEIFSECMIEELVRGIKKNVGYIEDELVSEGYTKLIIVDEELYCLRSEVFTKLQIEIGMDNTEKLNDIKIAILSLYSRDEFHTKGSKAKIIILQDYFKLMTSQLKYVTQETIKNYLELFGYSRICFDDNNYLSKKLSDMLEGTLNIPNTKKEIDSDDTSTLYITEYLNNENEKILLKREQLGIRQFLYELEVISKIPIELVNKLNIIKIEDFIVRFINISVQENWTILFSQKTKLSEMIIKRLYESDSIVIKNWYLNDCDKPSTDKVIIINNGNDKEINLFYEKYKYNYRIEKHRYIVLFRAFIMEEIVSYFGDVLSANNVQIYTTNTYWGINNIMHPQKEVNSLMIEKRKQYEIANILSNLEDYNQFLHEIYNENYSEDYVKNIMDIPPKLEFENGYIRHQDKKSRYLNVVNGERYTQGQPEEYDNTIYMLGGCTFFGYAVEDNHTIASFLQKEINNGAYSRTWKVVNLGTWGGNIDQTYKSFYNIKFKQGDIVIVNYSGYMPLGGSYQKYDISKALQKYTIANEFYFNGIVHPNHMGYHLMAKELQGILEKDLNEINNGKKSFYLDKTLMLEENHSEMYEEQINEYIIKINDFLPKGWENEQSVGGIVMNCNPFTLGHQYLIEMASKKVNLLFIFVVEEDKSVFKFTDRFQLVKEGVAHLKNVVVLPSGNLIISTTTFPGYFIKDEPNQVQVDTSLDVEIFAQYIAPRFHIITRFVGEEPFDLITRQYNESMKKILPSYGIEVIEIPRKKGGNEIVISASHVRRLLKNKEYEEIKKIVPETTYNYLIKLQD